MIPRMRPEIETKEILRLVEKISAESLEECKEKLEKELKNFFGVEKVILTFSGRQGLFYLFKSLKEKRVYIPAYTCWVVIESAVLAKKEVKFIDIEPFSYNMDIRHLETELREDSIVVATHQFGIPCKIEEILEIAQRKKARVIEDNAAAFGTTINGKKTGSFGEASILSFEYSKALTSGKGGAVLFQNEELFKKVKKMMDSTLINPPSYIVSSVILNLLFRRMITHPSVFSRPIQRLFVTLFGPTTGKPSPFSLKSHYSYRYPSILAFIGLENFSRIDSIIDRRLEIAGKYTEALVELAQNVIIPPLFPSNTKCSLMRYPLRIKKIKREKFFEMASKMGVDIGFTFSYSYDEGRCLNATEASKEVVNLPLYSELSDKEVEKTIRCVVEVCKKYGI